MTGEFGVPGYIPPEEHQRQLDEAAAEEQRRQAEALEALLADLDAKILRARGSDAPFNCVIEEYGSVLKGFFSSVKKGEVIESHGAWYLGGWSQHGDYVGTDQHHHYAIDKQGRMFENREGVGERQEFRIGAIPYPNQKDTDIKLGGRVSFSRENPHLLGVVVTLPGWDALTES